ncbi:MAG: hypothetical protein WD036_06475 [Bauldia sp.]
MTPALADRSASWPPIVAMGEVDTDPAQYGWLSENTRKALGEAIAQYKSGAAVALVFAGAPGGDFWAYRSAAKGTDLFNIGDLARQALESCEYFARSPCFIVSINGKDARAADGGLPEQPSQLADQPETFDAGRVPFVPLADQRLLQAYRAETRPRVLVVTPTGGWLWRSGDNLFAATAQGFTDCQTTYPNQICLLYAVNNRVVFTAGGPY